MFLISYTNISHVVLSEMKIYQTNNYLKNDTKQLLENVKKEKCNPLL